MSRARAEESEEGDQVVQGRPNLRCLSKSDDLRRAFHGIIDGGEKSLGHWEDD